jgi:hypothetical protein
MRHSTAMRLLKTCPGRYTVRRNPLDFPTTPNFPFPTPHSSHFERQRTNVSSTLFEQLDESVQTAGPAATADLLAENLRAAKRYAELFEVLKMRARIDLGLPAVHTTIHQPEDTRDILPEEIQEKLDKQLIEACREVGTALMSEGKLQEGWMYLRAVGDRVATSKAMRAVPVTQDNLDTFLGLLVHEAIDVRWGTELSLSMRGTCNTITMLDSVVAMRGREDQQQAVEALVAHVHQELLTNLRGDIARRENWKSDHPEQGESSIEKLLLSRPALLRDGSYHLDTTHIASTVRFARILDNKESLRKALDLAHYGKLLHPQYQYPSEEPFAELYPMSLAMFRALLGEHVDAALKMFLQKAESLDPQEHGTVAIETYADLLTRVGKADEAMRFLIKKMPKGMRPFGIAPSLIELAEASGNYELMLAHAKERFDEVGYVAALLQRATSR